MYAELKTAFVYVVWRPFPGVGLGKGGTIYVYNWLLFQYLLLESTFIFFFFFLNIELINFSFAALCIY